MIFIDQIGRSVVLEAIPKRIVSLVPSQTELLADLGLNDEVVGITKFCIHPHSWYKSKKRIGGTKQVDFDLIKSLNPDLIIANKEENTKEMIEELSISFPVWVSDVNTLDEALEMIDSVGQMTGKQDEASVLCHEIAGSIKNNALISKGKVKYFIWKEPNLVAGKQTFIDDMLRIAGFENLVTEARYPVDDEKNIPDYIFLSSEPFPFKEVHIEEFKEKYPSAKVVIVDGEMFSWYGSRLLKSAAYFKTLNSALLDQF